MLAHVEHFGTRSYHLSKTVFDKNRFFFARTFVHVNFSSCLSFNFFYLLGAALTICNTFESLISS